MRTIMPAARTRLLTAKNKWLIGHPEGGLPEGTHLGLTGENLCVKDLER